MREVAHWTITGALVLAISCGGGEDTDGDVGAPAEATPETEPAEGPGDEAGPADGTAETVSGQSVFVTNCATCHGESGTGEGPAAIGLEPPPADLTDGEWVTGDGSYEAVRNTIENGSPGTAMIGWKGTLTEAEIDAVTRHVRSLSGSGG